jgi:hypothetical protein
MDKVIGKLDYALQVGRTFGVRSGMLRLKYELQRGSGLMSRRMRAVEGWASWNLDCIAPGVRAERMLQDRCEGQRFFFSDARILKAGIKKIVGPQGESQIIAEADGILKGNLCYFGALSLNGGFPPLWFRNPATGQSVSPDHPWTEMRFASPVYGDLKYILEPSRFLFVYPLVRAYALTGEDRFAEAFWSAIEDWAMHSPPMQGPLWICGQECSLRILAWSFALQGFIRSPATTSERAALLFSMIAAHAWRTAQTIGYARSQRSNHLISEAVGLWTAGALYPELKEAQVWQKVGAELLREAVIDQITKEGVSHQHSFNYHRMILHLLLWAVRLSEICDLPLSAEIRRRTDAASEFINTWVDPLIGSAPNYGANDGSLILPLACSSYSDFRPLVQLSAAVLKRPALQPNIWDEPAVWFGVQPVAREDVVVHSSFDAGYFRLGDESSWAMIRAGRYTRRPFQADQLHVDLWWNGINLAQDAGTYLYNGPEPWNNGLAGSAVHNTVTIDHQDQMRRAGRFLWLDWTQASGRIWASTKSDRADCFEGEHDGYKRIGVTHRRMVRWLAGCGWVIVDDLVGGGTHDAYLHWLLADLPFEMEDSSVQVSFKSESSSIRWNIFCSAPGDLAILRRGKQVQRDGTKPCSTKDSRANLSAEEIQLLGWVSPTYGEVQPAVSLVYHTRAELPVRFVTSVLTSERCSVKSSQDDIVVSDSASFPFAQEVYRDGLRLDRSAGVNDLDKHSVSATTV